MVRTYGAAWRIVKGIADYLLWVAHFPRTLYPLLLLLLLLPATPCPGWGQGLPAFAPINPVASSRSGLSFQPYREPAPGQWRTGVALDYASVIEYNRLPQSDYVLDSEVLRLSFGLSRDFGRRTFLALGGSVGGAYAGFLDGFLDWYHGVLGIRMVERERRPKDRFLYTLTLPDGRTVRRASSNLYLGDVVAGLGVRYNAFLQTVLSLTLPTSTAPEGYRRGVPSLGVLNTLRSTLNPHLVYEGGLGLGFTPSQGGLADFQRTLFVNLSSGLRLRFWGQQSVFANLLYHSPYYHDTSLPALDRRELSLDFGWLLPTRGGGEWRMGLTEDLEPAGPGVDLVFRMGRTF